VTVAHSATRDFAAHTRRADILVAAMGSPRTITADMVRDGTVVIDVWINRVPDSKAVTPVPGGVGPMTIAMLLSNNVRAAEIVGHRGPPGPSVAA